jgi:hypothetical protein
MHARDELPVPISSAEVENIVLGKGKENGKPR